MKLLFYAILSLIISNFNDIRSADVTKLEKCTESDNKTKFSDLNDDCVFLILESLDLDDLLSLARINDEFSTIAADVFSLKYSQLQVIVRDEFLIPNERSELLNVAGMRIETGTIDRANKALSYLFNNPSNVEAFDTYIELGNGVQMLNAFKHFGHVIKKLKFITQSSAQTLQAELIGKLISKYSSESLLEIEFIFRFEKLLIHITKPLINVESVTIKESSKHQSFQNIRCNEIFPALRRLKLDSLTDYSLDYFDYHMPHLKHISMIRSSRNGSPFPGVILKNPQIRSMDLCVDEPEFVRNVSIYLPQLESIRFSGFELRNGNIRFENVTTLHVDYGYYTSPINLHFPRLQTLRFDYSARRFYEYLTFLNEHNHLSQLHLKTFQLEDSTFQQLIANLTDLEEITVQYENNLYKVQKLSSEVIENVLRSRNKMNQFNVINFPKQWEIELHDRLKHEWNARTIGDGLSLRRKWKYLQPEIICDSVQESFLVISFQYSTKK